MRRRPRRRSPSPQPRSPSSCSKRWSSPRRIHRTPPARLRSRRPRPPRPLQWRG